MKRNLAVSRHVCHGVARGKSCRASAPPVRHDKGLSDFTRHISHPKLNVIDLRRDGSISPIRTIVTHCVRRSDAVLPGRAGHPSRGGFAIVEKFFPTRAKTYAQLTCDGANPQTAAFSRQLGTRRSAEIGPQTL